MPVQQSRGLLSAAAAAALVLGAFVAGPPAAAAVVAPAAGPAASIPAVTIPSAVADSTIKRATKWVNPLKAESYRFSSTYGPRCIPVVGGSTLHQGQDLALAEGSPIYAAADGRVVTLRSGTSNVSGYIVIEHNDNGRKIYTAYIHMWSATTHVKVGQLVTAGQQISKVGNSGPSTAPHLHFEVWTGALFNSAIDPVAFMNGKGVSIKADAYLVYSFPTPISCTYYSNKATSLKATPYSTSATLRTVARGAALTSKPGTLTNGYVPVTIGGVFGWIDRYALNPGKVTLAPVADTVVPTTTVAALKNTKYTTTAALNLRSRAIYGAIVKTMTSGSSVTATGVVTTDKKWYQVKHGTTTGWASAAYLKAVVVKPAPAPVVTPPATKTVAALKSKAHTVTVNLNLRKTAKTGAVLKTMPANSAVTTTGLVTTDSKWYQVKSGTVTGWVDASYLKAVPVKAPVVTAPKTKTVAALKNKSHTVNTNLNLRQTAVSGKILTILKRNSKVVTTGLVTVDSKWAQVKSGTKTGWTLSSALKATPAKATTKTVASLKNKALTVTTNLNLRQSAVNGKVLVTLKKNSTVTSTGVVTLDSKWYQVKAGTRTGWTLASALKAKPAAATPVKATTKKATTNVNMRKGAGSSFAVVVVVKKGQTVTLTGKKSGPWVQIKLGAKTGWVSASYLK